MLIDAVYISTYRNDLPLTRICVASIRYWYADVPIKLIKDTGAGQFDTQEIEHRWHVQVVDTGSRSFGWGFAKLEPLFFQGREKFLMVDSDTVFTGRVLDMLNQHDEQFIVDDETQPAEEVKRLYYDPVALAELDPSFKPSGKNFNSGQWVGTSGVLTRDDFAGVVQWLEPPRLKYPQMFMPGDQGVLNYVLEKSCAMSRSSLVRVPLMWWAPRDLTDLDLQAMAQDSPYNRIIHWAGCKLYAKQPLPRQDILRFFENHYYSRVPSGAAKRRWRAWQHYAEYLTKRTMRSCGRRLRLTK